MRIKMSFERGFFVYLFIYIPIRREGSSRAAGARVLQLAKCLILVCSQTKVTRVKVGFRVWNTSSSREKETDQAHLEWVRLCVLNIQVFTRNRRMLYAETLLYE